MDIYNLFNSGAVVAQNNAFATTSTLWAQPQTVLSARLAKLSVVFDF
jgi:hypothetical protein